MNPVIQLLIILILGIEITFTQQITINIIIILASAILIAAHRPTKKEWVALFLSPLLPAIGSLIAQLYFGNFHQGWILCSRIYAYVWMGGAFLMVADAKKIVMTLEQCFHFPTKVVYGVYGAMNLIPQTKHAVQSIRWAALMRGVHLSFWSPSLYFKAILKALQWSDELANAMVSHGFVEDAPRTYAQTIQIPKWQFVVMIVIGMMIPAYLIIRVWL